jgi:hypothetical protein
MPLLSQCIAARPSATVIDMEKLLPIPLLTALTLLLAGCASQPTAPGDEIVSGSAGVHFQSQSTSHFMPDRAPR